MRVLIVYPRIYVYGGAELLLVRLCNYLSQKGVENTLLTTSIIPEVEREFKGTDILIEKRETSKGLMESIKFPVFLCKSVKKYINDFDLINVHNYPSEFSAFASNKPVVWMCNEPELYLITQLPDLSFRLRLFFRLLFSFERFVVKNYMKRVVVADRFNADRFKRLYGITPDIIHYGIDYEFFGQGEPEKARDRFGLSDDFVVVHVSMLNPFKNQIESIKTAQQLRDKIPHIKLLLVGWGEERDRAPLENYVRDNNLKENVLFVGHLNKEDLRDLFHACDVVLHPIKSQGGWLSPFEALCAGKPIVVSEEMTASDIVKKENLGIVTSNYAGAVLDVYQNPNKYKEMAEWRAKWVKGNLSWDRFGEDMLKVFNRALMSKG